MVLDLVASLVIVDVVRHCALLGRVENDEVHGVLPNSGPSADAERATCEMMDQDLALPVLVATEHHGSIWHKTRASHIRATEAFARLHCLHGEVCAHRLWDGVNVLTSLKTLLGEELDFGAAAEQSQQMLEEPGTVHMAYRFWNQIWTDLSVMLISSAILSRTVAVGVGLLLNSTSKVVN